MTHTTHGIVIGFDGSEDSRGAVEYAASASQDLGLPLRVIHCYAWSEAQTAVFHSAGRLLADLCESLEPHYPDIDIQPLVLSRSPASALVGESKTAQMIVVGHEGMGTFGGRHTGAVSRQVINQASCPVVVTRGPTLPNGPVVLGIAGWEAKGHSANRTSVRSATEEVGDAVQFAFVEAARREVPLRTLYIGPDSDRPVSPEVEDLIERWRLRYPTVEVTTDRMRSDEAADHLVDIVDNVGLVVLGIPEEGHAQGIRMGAFSSLLLSEAHCPVAIADTYV